jgi:hypothetical protein
LGKLAWEKDCIPAFIAKFFTGYDLQKDRMPGIRFFYLGVELLCYELGKEYGRAGKPFVVWRNKS